MNILNNRWDPKDALKKVQEGGSAGIRLAAEHLLEAANLTVPRDTGELADSGEVDVDETSLVASVSYSAQHAVYQHESPHVHLSGRAKWLELTLQENPRVVLDDLATGLKGVFD